VRAQTVYRLAGLGALGAIGLFALFLGWLGFVARPTATGGMNPTQSAVTWIAYAGVFAALAGAHFVLGRQLLWAARDRSFLP
jgi:ABC-type uncharacterized transport system permease subunit